MTVARGKMENLHYSDSNTIKCAHFSLAAFMFSRHTQIVHINFDFVDVFR